MKAIIITQNDYINGSGNRFVKKFNTAIELTNNNVMSLHSLDMYLSWRNLSKSQYNNTSFQYIWIDNVTYDVEIPSGGYNSIAELNLAFLNAQDSNLHFLTNDKGVRVYYANIVENSVNYRFQINIDCIPQVLPSGWTKSGTWSLPSVSKTPQIKILDKSLSNFYSIVGFNPGTYPLTQQSSSYGVLGQETPIFQPVTSIIVRCNAVNSNSGGLINDMIFTFSPGGANSTYGSLLSIKPTTELWMGCVSNQYSELILTFYDQNFLPLVILDSQLMCVLLIK